MQDEITFHLKDHFNRFRRGESGYPVQLRCLLLARKKKGKQLYLTVQDETETAQMALKKDSLAPNVWERATELRAGDPIELTGVSTQNYVRAPGRGDVEDRGSQIGDLSGKATIEGTEVKRIDAPEPIIDRGRRVVGLSSPITQVYIARALLHKSSEGFTA